MFEGERKQNSKIKIAGLLEVDHSTKSQSDGGGVSPLLGNMPGDFRLTATATLAVSVQLLCTGLELRGAVNSP